MVDDRSRLALPQQLALPSDDIVPRASDGDRGANDRHPLLARATRALKAFNEFRTWNTHVLGKTLGFLRGCSFSEQIRKLFDSVFFVFFLEGWIQGLTWCPLLFHTNPRSGVKKVLYFFIYCSLQYF